MDTEKQPDSSSGKGDVYIHHKLIDAMHIFNDMVNVKFKDFQRNDPGECHVVTTHSARWRITNERQYWTLSRYMGDGSSIGLHLTLICDYGLGKDMLYSLLHISIPEYNIEQTVPLCLTQLVLATLNRLDEVVDSNQFMETFKELSKKAVGSLEMVAKAESFGSGIVNNTIGTPYHK